MSATPPEPPAPKRSAQDTVRNYVGVAFVISILVHLVFGGFFANYKAPKPDKEVTEKVSVSKKIVVKPPTPPPTPKPTPTPPPPTPPPKQTPPPVKTTAPPPVKKLKLEVVKTKSTKTGPSEAKYVAPKFGDQSGIPAGNAATGAPAKVTSTAPPATAPPAPTTAPTPAKPSCTVPNQDASVVNKVDPDYPDAARQVSATGTARIRVDLSPTGTVTNVAVYQSAGNASLDQAAMKAARESTYSPEIVDCQKTAKSYLFLATFDAQ